jgi:PadR family transcriptional regulator, regulatory protein PadR
LNQLLIQNLTTELKRGTQIMVVLHALRSEQYGYSLLQDLETMGVLMEAGTLYPLLRRLETQGLLESTWDTTETRPRKFYRLSPIGLDVLKQLKEVWKQIVMQMQSIVVEERL